MTSHGPLIATIVAGLVLAFALGTVAHRLRISPLVGYLLAGVAVGPFTPGFVADQPLATELAEIGVILLMFGVGLHFSFKELIGEFSFILAGLGVALGVLPETGRDLILAGAILSIMLNPLAFSLVDRLRAILEPLPKGADASAPVDGPLSDLQPTKLNRHAVVAGFGRVGCVVADGLRAAGYPVLAIEERTEAAQAARDRNIEVLVGNAADPQVLVAANLPEAQLLMVAVPGAFDAGQIVEQARAANSRLRIVARAHSDTEVDYLMGLGASSTIMGEREIARGMLEEALKTPDAAPPPQDSL